MAKFFKYAFGEDGDRTAIPNTTQPSGNVSYQEGFGFDYERELGVDPDAKAVPRDESNQLYFDITDAIRQYQTQSIPDFITTSDNGGVPWEYVKFARVRYDDGGGIDIFTSLVDGNDSLPSDATKWRKGDGGITNLTGDVVANGPGSVAATIQAGAVTTPKIAAEAVTVAKIQQLAANTLLGNFTGSAATPQAVEVPVSTIVGRGSTGNIIFATIGTGLTFLGGVLSAPGVQYAANTVVVNATTGTAFPTGLALAANRLLGRGSSGNIGAITPRNNLAFDGQNLDVVCTQSQAATGYIILPGGLVMQWGSVASLQSGGLKSVSFPVAFAVAPYEITFSFGVDGSPGGTMPEGYFCNRSASGFNINITTPASSSAYYANWFAIGR